MGETKSDVLQGTLDLMVLKTLESLGPLHGYGIARRIEQVSDNGHCFVSSSVDGLRRNGARPRQSAAPSSIH
jgi:hypothetical protein